MQPEKDPIQFTRLLTENRISNERHNRELAELHEGWRMREAELLAHIERLESAVQAVKDWDIENFKERGAFVVPQEIRQMIQAATSGEGE